MESVHEYTGVKIVGYFDSTLGYTASGSTIDLDAGYVGGEQITSGHPNDQVYRVGGCIFIADQSHHAMYQLQLSDEGIERLAMIYADDADIWPVSRGIYVGRAPDGHTMLMCVGDKTALGLRLMIADGCGASAYCGETGIVFMSCDDSGTIHEISTRDINNSRHAIVPSLRDRHVIKICVQRDGKYIAVACTDDRGIRISVHDTNTYSMVSTVVLGRPYAGQPIDMCMQFVLGNVRKLVVGLAGVAVYRYDCGTHRLDTMYMYTLSGPTSFTQVIDDDTVVVVTRHEVPTASVTTTLPITYTADTRYIDQPV